MEPDEFRGVVLKKVRSDGLVMSRVPKPTRDKFLDLANAEFAGDYGLTLKYLWDQYEMFMVFMSNWNIKLDYILQLLTQQNESSQSTKEEDQSGKEIKLLDGRRVVKGGKNNE